MHRIDLAYHKTSTLRSRRFQIPGPLQTSTWLQHLACTGPRHLCRALLTPHYEHTQQQSLARTFMYSAAVTQEHASTISTCWMPILSTGLYLMSLVIYLFL